MHLVHNCLVCQPHAGHHEPRAHLAGQGRRPVYRALHPPHLHPVLVIGNLHDPATPYAGAQAAAGMLPNSRLLTLNGWGHTSLGRSACVDRYITGYLVNLTLPPAGTVCQSNQRPFGAPAAVESSRAAAALAELLPAPLVRALPSW